MRIIAVMSPKGGIGKTTTSDSIAYMLGEEQGKRVLVLDGDPQGDTSKTFGVFEPDGIGMSELLEKHECVGGTYKTGDLIRPTEYSHVDIIPANGYIEITQQIRATPLMEDVPVYETKTNPDTGEKERVQVGTRQVVNGERERLMIIQDRCMKQCRQGASDFGLTVSSRCRLVVPKPQQQKPENKFAKYAN